MDNKQNILVCFFEDRFFDRFYPLTYLRPVYLLRAGILELYKQAERYFPQARIIFTCRDQLAPLISEMYSDYPVNIINRGEVDVLFVNGRLRDWGDISELVSNTKIATVFNSDKGEPAAVLFKSESLKALPTVTTQREYEELFHKESEMIPRVSSQATLYNYCWELVVDIKKSIRSDFEYLRPSFTAPKKIKVHDGAYLINEDDIFLGDDIEMFPGAVIDATLGPVYIGNNTRIESHTAIYGPCFIGANSVVVAGKITHSSIGHTCRVGGEVEESIFHAYINKYHAGFIGHSYVGQWVNFGAMTTNSDLKNTYSDIKITVNGDKIDTHENKVGSFIGDHTKFGIGTLLTTGINIGVCCNIFGGTLITDKEVPSFRWGDSNSFSEYNFDKAIEISKRVAQRRSVELSEREISLLSEINLNKLSTDGVIDFI